MRLLVVLILALLVAAALILFFSDLLPPKYQMEVARFMDKIEDLLSQRKTPKK